VFDFQSKIKRQIEILGLCLSGQPLRTCDLAIFFNVEELTIKRDLQDLRSYGIDIHSHKKTGLTLDSQITPEKLLSIILSYSGLSKSQLNMDRSTMLLIEKYGCQVLTRLVLLQRCIDNSEIAIIDYNKIGDKIQKDKVIEPLHIFQSEGCWRVIVNSDGKLKQLIFEKILVVKPGGKRFVRKNSDISELVKYSWKSWLGTEKYQIKLWISPFWTEIITPRVLAGDQDISKNADGSVIFQCTVNSLNEIAGWIVSRGEGIKVLEPEELKERVTELAEGVLQNYK
jgi:predicted DNA-binding transcriptional regulator YafY